MQSLEEDGSAPLCCKCKSSKFEIYSRKSPYCERCFVYHFESRARMELNGKRAPPGSRALLLLSGGPSSRALLHLVCQFQDSRHKIQDKSKVKFSKIYAGYIEESIFNGESFAEFVKNLCEKYSVELVVKPAKDLFDESEETLSKVSQDKRRDLMLFYRRKCINALLEQLSCNILISGESSEKRAADILLHISKGRGVLVSREIEFPTLRPMSHITNQEISFYNLLMGLESRSSAIEASEDTMEGAISSMIQELTPNFPMTSSIVVSIADRISIPCEKFSGRCEECKAPREAHAREWLASKSLGVSEFSSLCYACIRFKSYLQENAF